VSAGRFFSRSIIKAQRRIFLSLAAEESLGRLRERGRGQCEAGEAGTSVALGGGQQTTTREEEKLIVKKFILFKKWHFFSGSSCWMTNLQY